MTMPSAAQALALDADGYAILRGAIPRAWIAHLRSCFDANVLAADAWPVPRGHGLRHAMVEGDAAVQRTCRLPVLLAAAARFLRQPFFLAQVEGREPLADNGAQLLHRDGGGDVRGQIVSALAFLDDYGPANGATQLVPGTHRSDDPSDVGVHPRAVTLSGEAGDILVFDADLLHGGTRNTSGERRRSLLISYFAEPMRKDHIATVGLRGVRMPPSETFGAH